MCACAVPCCDHRTFEVARLKGQFRCQRLLWRTCKPPNQISTTASAALMWFCCWGSFFGNINSVQEYATTRRRVDDAHVLLAHKVKGAILCPANLLCPVCQAPVQPEGEEEGERNPCLLSCCAKQRRSNCMGQSGQERLGADSIAKNHCWSSCK